MIWKYGFNIHAWEIKMFYYSFDVIFHNPMRLSSNMLNAIFFFSTYGYHKGVNSYKE